MFCGLYMLTGAPARGAQAQSGDQLGSAVADRGLTDPFLDESALDEASQGSRLQSQQWPLVHQVGEGQQGQHGSMNVQQQAQNMQARRQLAAKLPLDPKHAQQGRHAEQQQQQQQQERDQWLGRLEPDPAAWGRRVLASDKQLGEQRPGGISAAAAAAASSAAAGGAAAPPPPSLTPAQRAVRIAFFLSASLLNLVAVSSWWARAADVFSAEAAARLFGILGAGATLGEGCFRGSWRLFGNFWRPGPR